MRIGYNGVMKKYFLLLLCPLVLSACSIGEVDWLTAQEWKDRYYSTHNELSIAQDEINSKQDDADSIQDEVYGQQEEIDELEDEVDELENRLRNLQSCIEDYPDSAEDDCL